MSLVKANAAQIGQSVTATNNFTMYQPASPDGTVRWGVGNSGSVTDIVTLNSSGYVGIGISSPNARLNVQDTTANNGTIWLGGATYYSTIKQDAVSTGALLFNVATANGGATLYQWQKGGTTQMTLDSSGNLGLGVTPSAWASGFKAFEIGRAGSGLFSVFTDSLQLTNNYYYNGTNYIYAASGYAERYHMVNGTHNWYTAPSGTAGNAISFTQAMTLDASGNWYLGSGSSTTARLVASTPSGDGTYSVSGDGTNYAVFRSQGSSYFQLGSLSAVPMTFIVNSGEKMRIDSSGNVGIGTTTIGYKLTVDGYVGIRSGNGVTFLNAANNYTSAIANGAGSGDGDITFSVGGTTTAKMLSSHNFQFNSGYGSVATAYGCRAWVNFNGTGTVAIRASGNVSSITDNGTGDYTVNFSTAMPDANYVINATSSDAGGTNGFVDYSTTSPTSSAARMIFVRRPDGALGDPSIFAVSVFR